MINENDELAKVKLELSILKNNYDKLKVEYDFIKAQNNNLRNDITVNYCIDNNR